MTTLPEVGGREGVPGLCPSRECQHTNCPTITPAVLCIAAAALALVFHWYTSSLPLLLDAASAREERASSSSWMDNWRRRPAGGCTQVRSKLLMSGGRLSYLF